MEESRVLQPSLSTIGVLREAFKTTRRNGKLVASILLLVFLSSSQLELGTKLALKSIKDDQVVSDSQSSSFEARRASSSHKWANQQTFTQTGAAGQRVLRSSNRQNQSSYGYNPGSYGYGYMDQRVLRSSQKANPAGTYYYVDQYSTAPIEDARDIRPSHHVNHRSYGYMDQSMRTHEVEGIHSSQQTNPAGLYGYMGQFVPRVSVKVRVTHSAKRANPSSYGHTADQSIPLVEEGVRAYIGMKLLARTVSWVILLFFLVAATSSTYEAHTAKVMSLKDVFLKFKESWKRPIHTSFCLTLISLGLCVLLVILAMLIQIFTEGSTAYVLNAILIVSSSFTYLHMAVRWMLSLVVSVLESDSNGLKAIDRAGELMKGKRIQASILMILFHLAMGAVHMASDAMTKKLDGWAKMAITIPFTIGLICVLKLFMFAVYTVYYHDREMSHKEEGAKGQVGLYVPIAAGEA